MPFHVLLELLGGMIRLYNDEESSLQVAVRESKKEDCYRMRTHGSDTPGIRRIEAIAEP